MPEHYEPDRGNPLIDALADWLVDQSLGNEPLEAIFEGTCKRLYAAGIPVSRAHVTFRTLHPLYDAQALVWRRDSGLELQSFAHGATPQQWQRSPLFHMVSHDIPLLRRHLTGESAILDFEILDDLVNDARRARNESALDFGLGLHVGDVLFGNIGVPERVEFSVVGPAANEVARLESLTKTVGARILVSELFGKSAPETWHPMGEFEVPGMIKAMPVYAMPALPEVEALSEGTG